MDTAAAADALSAAELIFRRGRTYSAWHDEPVSNATLAEVYALAALGPTSANCCPMRVVFVRSAEGKKRLAPCLSAGNVEKTMAAPATAILAFDLRFDLLLPELAPHIDPKAFLAPTPEAAERNARMNGTLQAGYFIMAARSLGLDCGPMGGFDKAKVDAAFLPEGRWKSNLLVNLGHGDASRLRPRAPRPSVEDACLFM